MGWLTRGWQVFPAELRVLDWVAAVRDPVLALARGAERRHGGTWGPGVDLMPNDGQGAAFGGPNLSGAAYDAAVAATGVATLHPAQVSVTYPGYPGRDPGESDGAHRFRRIRDAAHLDGLLPEGPDRRRHLREPHAYILGIALTETDPSAAPLVVYEGSHAVVRACFRRLFAGRDPADWPGIDVTEAYQATRRQVFRLCPRREVPLAPGMAVLVHRLAIHGVAPWAEGARADPRGRAVAYFRPCFASPLDWLRRP